MALALVLPLSALPFFWAKTGVAALHTRAANAVVDSSRKIITDELGLRLDRRKLSAF
jgi:hypothetical protein